MTVIGIENIQEYLSIAFVVFFLVFLLMGLFGHSLFLIEDHEHRNFF